MGKRHNSFWNFLIEFSDVLPRNTFPNDEKKKKVANNSNSHEAKPVTSPEIIPF